MKLDKISGRTKKAWWYSPRTGELTFIDEVTGVVAEFVPEGRRMAGNDHVLIVTDSDLAFKL